MEIDIKCENIVQGDLVKASRDCDVPCDLVLLKTSDPDGKCFITTANLDGETNLKTLYVPKGFPNDVSIGESECMRVPFVRRANIVDVILQIKFIKSVASSVKHRWPTCTRSTDAWRWAHHIFGVKSRSHRSVTR